MEKRMQKSVFPIKEVSRLQSSSVKSKSVKRGHQKSMQKEKSKYAQFEKSKQDREKAIGRKNGSTVSTLASVGAKDFLRPDGGWQ